MHVCCVCLSGVKHAEIWQFVFTVYWNQENSSIIQISNNRVTIEKINRVTYFADENLLFVYDHIGIASVTLPDLS